ncbi:MAG: dTMP kinase [bacterium]|nr:dTMP kinase [bacterium]
MKKRKKVVVFEGIDGSGKSTQARLLYFALKKRNISADLYHFPSEGIIGKFVRSLLEKEEFDTLDSKSRALLTASDFYSQYHRSNNDSDMIIFDRYFHSSYASNDALDEEWIKAIHQYAPDPDIVFFLDGEPKSIKERDGIDSGAKNEARQKMLSIRYKKIFENIPNITINANKDIETTHQEVLQTVIKKLNI